MKQLLVLLFIFQASVAFGVATSSDGHECEGKGLPPGEDGVSAIEKIQSQFELGHKSKFKLMMQRICNNLIAA